MTTLAHAGGLHEAALVLVPLAIVVVMLRIGAKKTPPDDEDTEDTGDDDQAQVT